MRISLLIIAMCCVAATMQAQVLLTCHNQLNRSPLRNVQVTVRSGQETVRTFNTGKKSEFDVELPFGKVYQIFLQATESPVMFIEVKADNVPQDKQDYRMRYDMNAPFVPKNDEDIDTTVFSSAPFHKVMFNGKNMMVDNASYNSSFQKTIIRKPVKKEIALISETTAPTPVEEAPPTPTINPDQNIIAGKVIMNNDKRITINNRLISLLDKDGKVIHQTSTNRYGAFSFTNVKLAQAAKLRMESKDNSPDVTYQLINTHGKTMGVCRSNAGYCDWGLTPEDVNNMVDNNFTINIGGKLVLVTPKGKQFFSNKTVYLANQKNTIIRETKTNVLGTFVFDDLKPDHSYFICVDQSEVQPGQRIDLLGKDDNFIGKLDTVVTGKVSMQIKSDYNKKFNELSIGENEMKMDIKATIYGDNVTHPIGKLKVILLNDNYEVIDSAITDDLGTFKFKYLPFLKRFYLSAENRDNILDVFKNILIYSSDANLIKIMTHEKGKRFQYKPVNAELSRMRDLEMDDPWLELIDDKSGAGQKPKSGTAVKSIVENILFENNRYDITPASKEILDKVILVLNTNKSLKIEIGAHTDSKGNEVANMKLSQLRAKTVSDYLVAAGIEQSRVIPKGYGESQILNKCKDNVPCTELEHALNRRIEFKIIEE